MKKKQQKRTPVSIRIISWNARQKQEAFFNKFLTAISRPKPKFDLAIITEAPGYGNKSWDNAPHLTNWELVVHSGAPTSRNKNSRGLAALLPRIEPSPLILQPHDEKEDRPALTSNLEWFDLQLQRPRCDSIPLRVFIAHAVSKTHATEDDRLLQAARLKHQIEDLMRRETHANFILAGDLNMNPWEKGMIFPGGLNADFSIHRAAKLAKRLPELSRIEKSKRKIGKNAFSYLFNPAWSALGRMNTDPDAPQGSFRFNSVQLNYRNESREWNLLDHIMPSLPLASLIQKFEFSIQKERFGSDHWPVILDLSF